MNVLIIGSSSKISQVLQQQLTAAGQQVILAGRQGPDRVFDADKATPEAIQTTIAGDFDAYVINTGVLYSKSLSEQSIAEMESSVHVNMLSTVRLCEAILQQNKQATVLIVGSESGLKGSYDTSYFLTKAAIRAYVRERALTSPQQRLVLLSPSTISDAGMTARRQDTERLAQYQAQHPKQRFLTSAEVAKVIADLLSDTYDYLSNTEIELNGGKFARMRY